MKLLIHFLLLSNLFARIVDLSNLEPGKRGDDYRVWVYFDERDQKSTIDLDPATIKRRVKHGIHGPTKYDYILKSSIPTSIICYCLIASKNLCSLNLKKRKQPPNQKLKQIVRLKKR